MGPAARSGRSSSYRTRHRNGGRRAAPDTLRECLGRGAFSFKSHIHREHTTWALTITLHPLRSAGASNAYMYLHPCCLVRVRRRRREYGGPPRRGVAATPGPTTTVAPAERPQGVGWFPFWQHFW